MFDLRVSVSIMQKVIYDNFIYASLYSTSMYSQLVNQMIWYPVGISMDILVWIINSYILVDFLVLEIGHNMDTTLILGSQSLKTIKESVDVGFDKIQFHISGREERLNRKYDYLLLTLNRLTWSH